MDDADKPAPQPKDTRTQSQIAADNIERLGKLKDQWEQFESPEEIGKRNVLQAQVLGEAMLRLQAYVPAHWHPTMLEVASQYPTSESEKSEDKETKDDQPTPWKWLVTREQLEADGWTFKKNSQGGESLHVPPKD